MPEGRRPRGVTPRLRSGAAAESTILRQRKNGREELPHAPTPEARGCGREEQPRLQGTVAARVQESLEDLFHVQGQKGRR